MGLREEIFEQPGILRNWLDTQLGNVDQIAQAIRGRQIDYVFLAARGTSDHAGVYAQYLWGSLNRLPVALAAPSLFTKYAESPRLRNALVVGLSQSGESPDIVSVLAEGRQQGALTLAITNAVQSPLAQAAEFTIDLRAGVEKAVAATKTYTAELMAVAALAAALSGDREHLTALRRIPDAVKQALEQDEAAGKIATRRRELNSVRRVGARLRLCDGSGVGTEIKGVGVRFRRCVLGGRFSARADRIGGARLSGLCGGNPRRDASRHAGAAPATAH